MSRVPTISCAGGVELPRLIYGTAWKKDATAGLVADALGQGFRGIDTARQPKHYDEAGLGESVSRSPSPARCRTFGPTISTGSCSTRRWRRSMRRSRPGGRSKASPSGAPSV